jgi:hypothetical protein
LCRAALFDDLDVLARLPDVGRECHEIKPGAAARSARRLLHARAVGIRVLHERMKPALHGFVDEGRKTTRSDEPRRACDGHQALGGLNGVCSEKTIIIQELAARLLHARQAAALASRH